MARTAMGDSVLRPTLESCLFEQSIGLPELLVDLSERSTFELDLSAQLVSAPSAEGSALCELPLGSLEPSLSSGARLGERTPFLLEKATAHLLFGREL
jgi:hypothetical protein